MTAYEGHLVRLRAKGIEFEVIPDLRGQPFYIVSKQPGVCPPREAETFYHWGMNFGPDGKRIYTWGQQPYDNA